MNTAIFLVLACCICALANGQGQYIVGGYDANIANFPYQGSYRNFGSHSCGCVLLSPSWVLTAAHCGGGAASHSVSFGATDRTQGKVVGLETITAHPSYGSGEGAYPNDIAVLKLASAISGENITPARMSRSRLIGGEIATISGWGKTCGFCGIPMSLRAADMDVLTDAEAKAIWDMNYDGNVHVCVHDKLNKGKGACNGDSGGPMVVDGVLHGVTSWGVLGCNTNFASTYTRVSAFVDWVCQLTGNNASGC